MSVKVTYRTADEVFSVTGPSTVYAVQATSDPNSKVTAVYKVLAADGSVHVWSAVDDTQGITKTDNRLNQSKFVQDITVT
jgi:hypothetical protein